MNLLRKLGRGLLSFAQWAVYEIVWFIGFIFAIAAFGMGLGPLFIDEVGREVLRQHWLLSIAIFMAVNAIALACLFLRWHLERRWPHVICL